MTYKIAINGLGRIGRNFLRVFAQRYAPHVSVIGLNDPAPLETVAHLIEFDSLRGRFDGKVSVEKDALNIGFGPMRLSHETQPEKLDWRGADLVLECSGKFTTPEDARRHFGYGAKRVVISAPAKGDAKTIVFGINEGEINAGDVLLALGSCTTNCLVPVADVLDHAFGIEAGMMTTVHCYTNSQPVQDAAHADLYRARAAALSMIPTTSGAAQTLARVLPQLDGRITSHAIRVPACDVSCIDLVVTLSQDTSVADVNKAFELAASGRLAGILDTTGRKLVSADFRNAASSAVIALDQTRLQGQRMARILAWYDNEWGFANRMMDAVLYLSRL
ncbi:MAG: type I glyceraldehyde-3-phosphate dehydrogenase [Pseudomonadota bacterium]